MSRIQSTQCSVRWTTRIVPALITAIVGYATYVVVKRICVDYLYHDREEIGLVLAFLILFFLFLLLTAATYLRTFWTVKTDPAVVPLLPGSRGAKIEANRRSKRSKEDDIEAQLGWRPADEDPDSPGLETFYRKNAFICESDGRPRWCHDCGQWKPDRASHSREIGRCVRKMDHYCPWVGGMVSESSFKYFTQFTFYCTMFCAVVLAACAYAVAHQVQDSFQLDPHILATLVLAAFFGFFSFLMATTAFRFVFTNQTNIDLLKKDVTYQIAVRVPLGTPATSNFATITYPLPRPEGQRSKEANGAARSSEPTSCRDKLARRKFAILKTEPSENPWHLGYRRNWQQIMGNNIFDYLFPVSRSPCTNHEDEESDYPFGPLLEELKARHGLTSKASSSESQDQEGIELRTRQRDRGRP